MVSSQRILWRRVEMVDDWTEDEQYGYGFSAGYGNMPKQRNTPMCNKCYEDGKKEGIEDIGLDA